MPDPIHGWLGSNHASKHKLVQYMEWSAFGES